MDYFNYKDGVLCAEDLDIPGLAQRFGTPLYVYSRATIERHWRAFDTSLADTDHLVCYAVKANSNLGVLSVLAQLGSGFDIVSAGELERVLRAGGDPARIVFSGVGKQSSEIERALRVGIHSFNVESESELARIIEIARRLDIVAKISLRVNPNVDAQTHPYISTGLRDNKFGIEIGRAEAIYRNLAQSSHVRIRGVDCHIGSQLTDSAPFVAALQKVLELVDRLTVAGIAVEHINIGGGLGIRYRDEVPPSPLEYVQAMHAILAERKVKLKLLLEPGRAIVGNAGILVTRVEYLKQSETKNFAIVDAAMNDLIRPALYNAWQEIIPVDVREGGEGRLYDVVGPVCETGDFLGKERWLEIKEGALLAIRSAGAYGFVMSSNYNSRLRVAEVLVDGVQAHLVRQRETLDDLLRLEQPLSART